MLRTIIDSIISLLSGPEGLISSKRTSGLILMVAAVGLSVWAVLTGHTSMEVKEVIWTLMASAFSFLGLTSIDYYNYFKGEDKDNDIEFFPISKLEIKKEEQGLDFDVDIKKPIEPSKGLS